MSIPGSPSQASEAQTQIPFKEMSIAGSPSGACDLTHRHQHSVEMQLVTDLLHATNIHGEEESRPPPSTGSRSRYFWQNFHFWLPSTVHLAPWCTLDDEMLEFHGSYHNLATARDALLEQAVDFPPNIDVTDSMVINFDTFLSLDNRRPEVIGHDLGFPLDFLLVDTERDLQLWICKRPTVCIKQLRADIKYQLDLWSSRLELRNHYVLSNLDPLIRWTDDPKVLVANFCCYEYKKWRASMHRGHGIYQELQAEVAFQFVLDTDSIEDRWMKCLKFVSSGRAKVAVGLCDRENRKEVFIAFKDPQGTLLSETMPDPHFLDLGMVLPGCRIYFSYMIGLSISHFKLNHTLHLRRMSFEDLKFQLCEHILQSTQADNELAMEIVNGLHSVNFVDSWGRFPLGLAIASKNSEMVHFLLSNKADPTYEDVGGMSGLLWAKAINKEMYALLQYHCSKLIEDETFDSSEKLSKIKGLTSM